MKRFIYTKIYFNLRLKKKKKKWAAGTDRLHVYTCIWSTCSLHETFMVGPY